MDIEKLDQALEAILLLAGDSVEISHLIDKLELQKSEIKKSVERLSAKYGGSCGIRLIQFDNKLQFSTNPEYADIVSAVLNPIKEKELSRASMEVMAIVAYKQPITRLEIDNVRGVNSDFAVQMLLRHNLIRVAGRKDTVGKPLLFTTTDDFLKRFGLENLESLPDYDELMARIKVIPDTAAPDSLYNEFEIPDEAAATTDSAMQNPEITEPVTETSVSTQPPSDDLPEEEIPDFLKDEKDLQVIK